MITQSTALHLLLSALRLEHKSLTMRMRLQLARRQRRGTRLIRNAVSQHPTRDLLSESNTHRIIQIQDGKLQSRPCKQSGLCRFVCLHGLVIIEVITRQIGVAGNMDSDAI